MSKHVLAFFFLTALFVFSASSRAEIYGTPYQGGAVLQNPAPLVSAIIIMKGERRLYLVDGTGKIIKSYKVSLGNQPVGDKISEGDGRTPEGKYTIDFKNTNSEFYKSLRISYPNPSDVWRAKKLGVRPGGDIFIHGDPNKRGWMFWKYNTNNDWTHGCIAIQNRDIDELWKLVDIGTTVLIKP